MKKTLLTLFIILLSITIFIFSRSPKKRFTVDIKHSFSVSKKHNIPLEDIDLYSIADEFDDFSSKLEKKIPFL